MTGSLQEKNDKFYMVLNFYENGKRKLKWIPTGLPVKGNRRKAEQMLRERLIEEERKSALPSSDMRLSDCVRLWLEQMKYELEETTFQSYQININAHILPYFDANGLVLKDCSYKVLQAYFDEQYHNGRVDGKGGLSPVTLYQLKNILNKSLDWAMREELIAVNPCRLVKLPRKERYEASVYSAEQVRELFSAFQNDPLEHLVKIVAIYGLRRSEVLGLRWSDIDFVSKRITIRATRCRIQGEVEKERTKNRSSRRGLPLSEQAEAIFLQIKSEEEKNRKQMGSAYQENEHIFKWPDGHLFSTSYVSAHFSLVLEKCALPRIRLHDLRHTCASVLLSTGFSIKDTQDWLGHSDIRTTANIYGHLDSQRKSGIANSLSLAFL